MLCFGLYRSEEEHCGSCELTRTVSSSLATGSILRRPQGCSAVSVAMVVIR